MGLGLGVGLGLGLGLGSGLGLGLVGLSVTRRLDDARKGPVVAVVLVELDDLPHGVGPLDHLVRVRMRVRVRVRVR